MSTRTKKPAIQWASSEEIWSGLKDLDFQFWFRRESRSRARELVEKQIRKRVRASDFRKVADEKCEWWKNSDRPRRSPSKELLLDAKGWEQLRIAVRSVLDAIQGRPIREAVAIVSIHQRCNEDQLRGLNKDLQVWED